MPTRTRYPGRRSAGCRLQTEAGFTLVELMVTIAVAAILLTVAIPSFSNLIRDNRIVAGTNQLVTSFAVARSEAVKRGTSVSVCASTNGTACSASNWNQGWMVFTDSGTAGTVDGTDTVLRVQGAVSSDLSITVTGTAYASFRSTGFLADACGYDCVVPDNDELPLQRSMLSALLAAVLPGTPAYAAAGNSTGTSGTSTTTDTTGTATAAVTQFTICDGRSGETGRRISLWASGRVDTQSVTCDTN